MNYDEIKTIIAKEVKLDTLLYLGNGNFLIGVNHLTSRMRTDFKKKGQFTLPKEYTKSQEDQTYGNITR